MNPLEKILEWFDSLTDEQSSEISRLGTFVINDNNFDKSSQDNLKNEFKEYFRASNETNIVKNTLLLKATINMILCSKRISDDSEQAKEAHIKASESLANQGFTDNQSKEELNNINQNSESWTQVIRQWDSLTVSELSDKNIYKWFNNIAFKP